MGGDGGSTAGARKFLKSARADDVETDERESAAHVEATTCALSNKPLRPPVVACELGYFYNKEALLDALLEKRLKGTVTAHVSSLKDVHDVNAQASSTSASVFVCPVTGKDLNGAVPAVVALPSGRLYAASAIKHVPSLGEERVLHISPLRETRDALRRELLEKRAAKKRARAEAKIAKKKQTSSPSSSSTSKKRRVSRDAEHPVAA